MEHVKQLQIVRSDASDTTDCASNDAGGEPATKPRGAYAAPKLERLGSVANVALYSGGGTTFF